MQPTTVLSFTLSIAQWFPVIIGSGATISIIPFLDNYTSSIMKTEGAIMQRLATRLIIEGLGTVCWQMQMDNGTAKGLSMMAYYVPST